MTAVYGTCMKEGSSIDICEEVKQLLRGGSEEQPAKTNSPTPHG